MTDHRLCAVIAVLCCGLTGCVAASNNSLSPQPKAPGTVYLAIDGQQVAVDQRVNCEETEFWTTVAIGIPAAHLTAVIRNDKKLTAESVRIHGLGGFTGSYWRDLDGSATVVMRNSEIAIQGTAVGFRVDNPSSRSTATFQITAVC